jgi:hypothetical protein
LRGFPLGELRWLGIEQEHVVDDHFSHLALLVIFLVGAVGQAPLDVYVRLDEHIEHLRADCCPPCMPRLTATQAPVFVMAALFHAPRPGVAEANPHFLRHLTMQLRRFSRGAYSPSGSAGSHALQ